MSERAFAFAMWILQLVCLGALLATGAWWGAGELTDLQFGSLVFFFIGEWWLVRTLS